MKIPVPSISVRCLLHSTASRAADALAACSRRKLSSASLGSARVLYLTPKALVSNPTVADPNASLKFYV
jgi:hypothetical protein